MESTAPRLVFFAGLGADERVLAPQLAAFPSMEVPPWLDPHPRESLAHYARRMAARVAAAGQADGMPLFLGGVSFGGMIALEAAGHLRPRAVLLVSSCRRVGGLPPWYRPLGRALGVLPPAAMRLLGRLSPLAVPMFGPVNRPERRTWAAVMRDTPPTFLQWACGAIARWVPPSDLTMPVYHIHGACDRILPCRLARADSVIAGGGHLVNLTHPRQVNRLLRQIMSR